MRCRKIHIDKNGKKTVVWFGSIGRKIGFDVVDWDSATWDDSLGPSIIVTDNSYADRRDAVASSLMQRLSVIKRELWYSVNYGLPLFEKRKSKVEFDSFILSTISQHPDVVSVIRFSSNLVNAHYSCAVEIQSRFGQISLEV